VRLSTSNENNIFYSGFKNTVKHLFNSFISFFHQMRLKAYELTFLPLEYHEVSHKFGIVVFKKNDNLYCDTKTLQQAIFIIIQDIVGEKSFYRNINFVQLAQVPDNKDGVIKLYDFQLFLSSLNGAELNNYFLKMWETVR
jgi:hypothetical protein